MARKLFGTDGVRGLAGEFVSAELALALGRAATSHTGAARPRVVIVRDTRESGEMLQSALAAGVSSAGGGALPAGGEVAAVSAGGRIRLGRRGSAPGGRAADARRTLAAGALRPGSRRRG